MGQIYALTLLSFRRFCGTRRVNMRACASIKRILPRAVPGQDIMSVSFFGIEIPHIQFPRGNPGKLNMIGINRFMSLRF